MGKVSRDRMGTATPKITIDDLEEDVAIVTIVGYEEDEIDDPEAADGKRLLAKMFFEETGDKCLFLNATMVDELTEGFGSDDSDDWINKKVPIEKRKVKFGRDKFDKVYIVPAEDWDKYLTPARRAKPAKAASKRGKSKRVKR